MWKWNYAVTRVVVRLSPRLVKKGKKKHSILIDIQFILM